jgi:hypothetical protein
MMAGLKLGLFVKLEKSSLVIDISSIGLHFIFLIGCSVESKLIITATATSSHIALTILLFWKKINN